MLRREQRELARFPLFTQLTAGPGRANQTELLPASGRVAFQLERSAVEGPTFFLERRRYTPVVVDAQGFFTPIRCAYVLGKRPGDRDSTPAT